jgi:hypothetical protein
MTLNIRCSVYSGYPIYNPTTVPFFNTTDNTNQPWIFTSLPNIEHHFKIGELMPEAITEEDVIFLPKDQEERYKYILALLEKHSREFVDVGKRIAKQRVKVEREKLRRISLDDE